MKEPVSAEVSADGRAIIEFDATDLVACLKALDEIYEIIEYRYGVMEAQGAVDRNRLSKSALAKTKNFRLMVWYVKSKLSVDRFATVVADANTRLPRKARFGTGTTVAATMAKQIRRQIKRMKANAAFGADVEEFVKCFPDADVF
jgi:hypothetical protein